MRHPKPAPASCPITWGGWCPWQSPCWVTSQPTLQPPWGICKCPLTGHGGAEAAPFHLGYSNPAMVHRASHLPLSIPEKSEV